MAWLIRSLLFYYEKSTGRGDCLHIQKAVLGGGGGGVTSTVWAIGDVPFFVGRILIGTEIFGVDLL